MVDYAYRELFYKSHQTKDILIVDSDAVVTPVSGAAPTVEDATVEIHTADIKTNSFTLDESICSEDDLKWGLLESSAVSFTIRNSRNIPNLKNTDYSKALNIYIYFNGDSNTLFQVGQYICESDKYSADRRTRKIELYDVLHFLYDEDITTWYNEIYADNDNEPLTVKELRDGLFDYLYSDYDYPVEQNEETELVNDDCEVPKNIESDTITFGFFMGGILDANGVMGHIGRTGLFEYITLVKYDAETVATVTDDFRKPPTTYEDFAVWGIGYVRVYDRNNMEMTYQGFSSYRHPSVYNIVDNFVLNGIRSLSGGEDNLAQAALKIREQVTHRRYAPMDVEHVGDLCIEVGDNVKVTGDIGDYNTYVLERHLKGLGSMLDKYISRGNRKQPKYQINDNWHVGDSESGSSGSGSGGVSSVDDEWKTKFVKAIRNVGLRLLQEPSNVSVVYDPQTPKVSIKWTDPSDITNYKPVPCEWAGTVVVRKEGSEPWYPWDDSTILVDSTTRDQYSETAFEDTTIEYDKQYYYGIFPYHIALDDAEHPIKHYRFTKVIRVNTTKLLLAPLITSHTVNGTTVTLTFEVPVLDSGSYSYVKVVAKKGSIPANSSDGIVKSVNPTDTSVSFSNLDEDSRYFFVIFANDGTTEIASDPDDCMTGVDEGWNFPYTGSIQTFTAPKTGIYQLETWGAQGGNASDDNLVARGGYGAYAKGEVFLTQGETIYINVGGQDGYGGGGTDWYSFNQVIVNTIFESGETRDYTTETALIKLNDSGLKELTKLSPANYHIEFATSCVSSYGAWSSFKSYASDNRGNWCEHHIKNGGYFRGEDVDGNKYIYFCDIAGNKLLVDSGPIDNTSNRRRFAIGFALSNNLQYGVFLYYGIGDTSVHAYLCNGSNLPSIESMYEAIRHGENG